ncbi:hypothetical protein HanPSC8_Chr08g0328861 [Helianthus annuus]|nr:hypothetical protein HanPSC8_Chr08g0328861 [Helianthus annuus]
MTTKLPPPILFIIITIAVTITVTVTVTASPTSFVYDQDLLRLPSDDSISTALCPLSVNPSSCPVKCFRPDPVCGVDNVTYWCGCSEAHCAGVSVAKLGFCDVENGGSGPVSGCEACLWQSPSAITFMPTKEEVSGKECRMWQEEGEGQIHVGGRGHVYRHMVAQMRAWVLEQRASRGVE